MSNQNISENNKVCKFFKSENGCRHGDKCRFSHDNNNIKKSSFRSRPKNTESFVPSFKSADMNVYVGIPSNKKYDVNDVIIIPNFLNETIEKEIYNKLLNEINESGIDKEVALKWGQIIADRGGITALQQNCIVFMRFGPLAYAPNQILRANARLLEFAWDGIKDKNGDVFFA
jgi:hypothetical protein